MKLLPFKTKPSLATKVIGNPTFGELEFPVFGDLLVGERALLDEAENRFNYFRTTANAAVKIAEGEENLTYMQAHTFVTKVVLSGSGADDLTDEENDLHVKYHDLLSESALSIVKASYEQVMMWATILIQHRLEGMDEWTQERTAGLPQGLVNEIFTFGKFEAEGEASKTPEDKEAEEAALEEQLGKLRTVLGEVQNLPIGATPSGDASSTGQGGKNSAAKTSRSSRSASSKKPSAKASGSTKNGSTLKKSA